MLPTRSRRLQGAIEILLAGLGFGFLGVFGKLAFDSGLTTGELLTIRFFTASLVLALGLGLTAPHRILITKQQMVICALLGTMGYAVFSTLYFKSIEGVSISLAALLLYTYPIMVAVGARFVFNEKLSRGQWLALPATIIGLALLLYGETEARSAFHVISGILAALCYATYILVSSRVQKDIHPLTSGLYVIFFAALGLLLIHRPEFAKFTRLSLSQISIVIGIAVISTVAPLVFFLSGLQKLGSNEASILSTVEPLTAAIAGVVFFNESLSPTMATGGILILSSLIGVVIARPSSKV